MLDALDAVWRFNNSHEGIIMARPLSWRGQKRAITWDKGNSNRSKGWIGFPGLSQNNPALPNELFEEWEVVDVPFVLEGK